MLYGTVVVFPMTATENYLFLLHHKNHNCCTYRGTGFQKYLFLTIKVFCLTN